MKQPKIEIYIIKEDEQSILLKEWLGEQKLKYTEYDVAKSLGRLLEVVQGTNKRAIPAVKINGKFLVGFDKKKIKEELKKNAKLK
jgi:glutaredoxin